MRNFALLLLCGTAAIALSACSTLKGDDSAESARQKGTVAASAPVGSSDKEAKEMAAVMGDAAPAAAKADLAVPPTGDNPIVPAVPVTPVDIDPSAAATTPATSDATPSDISAAESTAVERGPAPAGAPKECPGVEVLPDTKSITYFDDPEGKPSGALIARASLVDIKGGCDYTDKGVVVDIDMIMKGKIAAKGRYEGRKDLEAFMTFPYFIAVMDPSGKMIDKKIMATAMRFQPNVDDLDHAEKITQSIPLPAITEGPKYTITVGFQLNRAQLDYNRGRVGDGPKPAGKAGTKKDTVPVTDAEKKAPVKKAAKPKTSEKPKDETKADKKAEAKPADVTPAADIAPAAMTDLTPAAEAAPKAAPAPAATESSAPKMTPIVE